MDRPSQSGADLTRATDEQLLLWHRQGMDGAFAVLIGRYKLELYHFLVRFSGNRAEADDLFQETFVQVHLWADRFDVERRLKPWLFTIAANKARDYLRKNRREPPQPLSAPVDPASGSQATFVDLLEADIPLPETAMMEEETRELVQQVLASMPDHLREVLLLSYFHQFAYKDIAEMLAIPVGTVKSRLHAAVAGFAQRWKERWRGDRL
ncbi:MAG: sigma-70 family RNA polymerase sigma factor [Phycisphaeraceae bacterium]|nr:sigma-70 family RNA polymerase sigma factor [Phycisphaeraceae bacterium]